MSTSTYITVKYIPDETVAPIGSINAAIHVLMYLYYLLSSFGPKMQKYLWWKKYLTSIQMVQFILQLSIIFRLAYDGCPADIKYFMLWTFNIVGYLIMFANFYRSSYKKPAKSE